MNIIKLVASNLGYINKISMFTNNTEALDNITAIRDKIKDHKENGFHDSECYFTCAK
jgi:hypothetical protein